MLLKKPEKSTENFWREYEEQIGEKVLARGLGKYISGWDEFDEKKWNGIWGLIITTSGGFRFHHFPQNSWIDALTRLADQAQIQDKTIFIPKEKIIATEIIKETKWWKKIFSSSVPQLVIRCKDDASQGIGSSEKRLLFEAEYKGN